MKDLYGYIENRIVFPVLIKNGGNDFLTLYYYTERSDSIFHKGEHLLYFQSFEGIERFCKHNNLTIGNNVVEYDFDALIFNPIDYKRVLKNWNLLNTIAGTFGMFFEGDLKKYSSLYDLLFRLNVPAQPVSSTYYVSEKYLRYILKVFRKKERFFNKFELYGE